MYADLKEKVYRANLDLVAHGLVTLTWGNASALSSDRRCFAIKPSGVPYQSIGPDDIVLVDLATGAVLEGVHRPSSDTPTHRVVYLSFSGIGGVTHTHSPRATSFAQACHEIPCLGTTHADHFCGPVPVTRGLTPNEIETDYEVSTGRVIAERFVDLDPQAVPAVLVARHGPFTWGRTAAEAVANAVALEAVADMALGTLNLNPGLRPIDSALLDKHHARKHGSCAYYGQTPVRS